MAACAPSAPRGFASRTRPGRQREVHQLLPKTPFVLGGGYDDADLDAVEAAKAMRIRGPVAQQLQDLPDGAKVTLSLD